MGVLCVVVRGCKSPHTYTHTHTHSHAQTDSVMTSEEWMYCASVCRAKNRHINSTDTYRRHAVRISERQLLNLATKELLPHSSPHYNTIPAKYYLVRVSSIATPRYRQVSSRQIARERDWQLHRSAFSNVSLYLCCFLTSYGGTQ